MINREDFVEQISKILEHSTRMAILEVSKFIAEQEVGSGTNKTNLCLQHIEYLDTLDEVYSKQYLNSAKTLAKKIYLLKTNRHRAQINAIVA